MKQFYKALFLPLLVSLGAAAPPAARAQSRLLLNTDAPGANSGWEIVARDEFDGSTLNTQYWQTHPNNAKQYAGWGSEWYDSSDPSLVTVANGFATLKAVRWRDGQNNLVVQQEGNYTDGTPRYLKFRSGMLSSQAGSPFRASEYGAYEARLRLPDNGEDAWPTFWLYGGPQGTEIDILDGARINNFWTNPGMLTGVIDWNLKLPDKAPPSCGQRSKVWSGKSQFSSLLSRQFNVYTAVWTPDRVTFFFNGREIQTVPRTQAPTQVLDMMINLQTNWWSNSQDSFTLDIDYVRLLRPTCSAANNCPGGVPTVDFKSYKSAYDNVNHDISQPTPNTYQKVTNPNTTPPETGLAYRPLASPTTYPKVSERAGSIALAPGDRVFYRDTTDHLCLATATGGGTAWTVTPLPSSPRCEVSGDVLYSPRLTMAIYKGIDARLQGYYLNGTGTWQHTWLTGTPNMGVDMTEGGAISLREADGTIVYRGGDKVLYYFKIDPNKYSAYVSNVYASAINLTNNDANPSATNAVGDVLWEPGSGNILYRGQDNRLQVYWWDGSHFNHSWVDDYWSTSANLMAAKPNTLVSIASGIYYAGQDDKVHRFVYDGTLNRSIPSTVPDPATYSYTNVGYSQAPLVRGSLSATPDGSHLNYLGYDGRLQTLYLDGASQWQHGWVDDYWSTDEFNSFNMTQSNIDQDHHVASAVSDNARIFYCDAFNHLRYFQWQLSENLATQCYNQVGTLHRTAAAAPTAAVTAAAVLDLSVAPNPTAGQVAITLPTALRALSLPYTLTSALGAVVQQGRLSAGHLTLELGHLPSGLYVLTTQAPGHVYHTRVVKE